MSDMLSKIELWLSSAVAISRITLIFLLISIVMTTLRIAMLEEKLHNTRFEMALKGIIPFEKVDK